MGKAQVSIGDDTPTGEPDNGPRGPYITDEDDGSRPPRDKNNDRKNADRDQRPPADDELPSRTETEISKRSELGSDR